eukprot:1180992-Prorocentrum_minimum.AAC.3
MPPAPQLGQDPGRVELRHRPPRAVPPAPREAARGPPQAVNSPLPAVNSPLPVVNSPSSFDPDEERLFPCGVAARCPLARSDGPRRGWGASRRDPTVLGEGGERLGAIRRSSARVGIISARSDDPRRGWGASRRGRRLGVCFIDKRGQHSDRFVGLLRRNPEDSTLGADCSSRPREKQ